MSIPSADNRSRGSVLDLVRPHLKTRDCLIVTGFLDMLSALAIIITELGPASETNADRVPLSIRLAFGVDTGNTTGFRGARSVREGVRKHFLERRGLEVEDYADLMAITALDAIEAGQISIRVYDSGLAKDRLGWRKTGKMHAKIVSSSLGAVVGSANFSRAGLTHNVEYARDYRYSGTEAPAARDAKSLAKEIWKASDDCNKEVLEVLNNLLRPVTPEKAVSRGLAEQLGYQPWRVDLMKGRRLTKFKLFRHQQRLIYDAAATVYEHGLAFVCAPAGSGKTAVGMYLAVIIDQTYKDAVPQPENACGQRVFIISPPRVKKSWEDVTAAPFDIVTHTELAKKEKSGGLERAAAYIVDESHRVASRFEGSSKQSQAMEEAPPAWTVFLSATPLGNHDIDTLTYFQEKRASIFAPPDYVKSMKDLLEAWRQEENPGALYESKLPKKVTDGLVKLAHPCVVICSREEIGIRTKKTAGQTGLYPRIKAHGRHKKTRVGKREQEVITALIDTLQSLEGGARVWQEKQSRIGTFQKRPISTRNLPTRNLQALLRMCPLEARREMRHGHIGRSLREIEAQAPAKPCPLPK